MASKFEQVLEALETDSNTKFLISKAHEYYSTGFYNNCENFLKAFCITTRNNTRLLPEDFEKYPVEKIVYYLNYVLYLGVSSALLYKKLSEKPFETPSVRLIRTEAKASFLHTETIFFEKYSPWTNRWTLATPKTKITFRRLSIDQLESEGRLNRNFTDCPVIIYLGSLSKYPKVTSREFIMQMAWLDRENIYKIIDSLDWEE